MNLTDRFKNFLFGQQPVKRKSGGRVKEERNTAGRTVGVRSRTNRDLSYTSWKTIQKEVWRLWCTSPLAEQYINIIVNHVLGEGLTVKSDNEKVNKVLKDFWLDKDNKLGVRYLKGKGKVGERIFSLCQEAFLFGEQFVLFYGVDDPQMEYPLLGQLDPYIVQYVITDPNNASRELCYILKKESIVNQTVVDEKQIAYYSVIANEDDNVLIDEQLRRLTTQLRASDLKFVKGVTCLHHGVNRISNQTRGRSILTTKVDWIDAVEDTLFDVKRRIQFLSAFVWDVLLKGGTPEEIEEKMQEIIENPPTPGSIRVHNENETWDAITPNLTESSVQRDIRALKLHCIQGFPEHWFAEGGNANRSTAREMGDPAVKMLSALQQQFTWLLANIVSYVLDLALAKGFLNGVSEEELSYSLETPDISDVDNKQIADAALNMAKAFEILIPQGVVTTEDANRIMDRVVGYDFKLPETPAPAPTQPASGAEMKGEKDAV